MSRTVNVGLAEIRTARPDDVLVALGLGSCIGVCFYDRRARIGGMVHVMLPECSGRAAGPGKYADTGVAALLAEMESAGAGRRDLLCAIGGGAEVFAFSGGGPMLEIGRRNAEAVRAALKAVGVRLMAEDVGGSVGRTVSLDTGTGLVTVRLVGGTERDLARLG